MRIKHEVYTTTELCVCPLFYPATMGKQHDGQMTSNYYIHSTEKGKFSDIACFSDATPTLIAISDYRPMWVNEEELHYHYIILFIIISTASPGMHRLFINYNREYQVPRHLVTQRRSTSRNKTYQKLTYTCFYDERLSTSGAAKASTALYVPYVLTIGMFALKI